MINKTFNSYSTDGRALEVGRNGERPWLNIRESDLENTMFMLAASDAPALALAILEVAGYKGILASEEPGNLIEKAFSAIRLHIKEQERATAEAKEQAELEAEALELENAGRDAAGADRIEELSEMGRAGREFILAVARKAREMRAEK